MKTEKIKGQGAVRIGYATKKKEIHMLVREINEGLAQHSRGVGKIPHLGHISDLTDIRDMLQNVKNCLDNCK